MGRGDSDSLNNALEARHTIARNSSSPTEDDRVSLYKLTINTLRNDINLINKNDFSEEIFKNEYELLKEELSSNPFANELGALSSSEEALIMANADIDIINRALLLEDDLKSANENHPGFNSKELQKIRDDKIDAFSNLSNGKLLKHIEESGSADGYLYLMSDIYRTVKELKEYSNKNVNEKTICKNMIEKLRKDIANESRIIDGEDPDSIPLQEFNHRDLLVLNMILDLSKNPIKGKLSEETEVFVNETKKELKEDCIEPKGAIIKIEKVWMDEIYGKNVKGITLPEELNRTVIISSELQGSNLKRVLLHEMIHQSQPDDVDLTSNDKYTEWLLEESATEAILFHKWNESNYLKKEIQASEYMGKETPDVMTGAMFVRSLFNNSKQELISFSMMNSLDRKEIIVDKVKESAKHSNQSICQLINHYVGLTVSDRALLSRASRIQKNEECQRLYSKIYDTISNN